MRATTDVIYARRFRAGSLAALVFTGAAALMVPMCLFFGVLAFFGANTIHLNGTYVTGVGGLLLSLVYGPFFAGLLGLFAWPAAYLGITLVGRWRPYRIEYVAARETALDQPAASAPEASSKGLG